MSEIFSGPCLCGAVVVEVTGASVSEGYCHCNDCRAWCGAPVTTYALWPMSQVSYRQGADKLVRFSKTGTTNRVHCSVCGSLVASELTDAGFIDVYPLRLEGRQFVPQAHVHYASRVIDMPDGVVKFADLPENAGGTGTTISD